MSLARLLPSNLTSAAILAAMLTASSCAGAGDPLAQSVRAKGEVAKRRVAERAAAGHDVAALAALGGEVAAAGEAGELARANALLDQMLAALDASETSGIPGAVRPQPSVGPGAFGNARAIPIENLPTGSGNTPISTEEPFVSRDGRFLFFNTAQHEQNKDLHYAERDGTRWVYRGEIGPGLNEPAGVQGNPTLDRAGNFYFVDSTVDAMLRGGRFDAATGRVTRVRELSGIPEKEVKLLAQRVHGNMGIELSADGTLAFFSRATFRLRGIAAGGIVASDLLFARRQDDLYTFAFDEDEARRVLARINTDDLEYAASISEDGLELFFTRLPRKYLDARAGGVRSQIMRATRATPDAPFGEPEGIAAIGTTHFVEGPSISPDGRSLYYHKREGDKFRLWAVTR